MSTENPLREYQSSPTTSCCCCSCYFRKGDISKQETHFRPQTSLEGISIVVKNLLLSSAYPLVIYWSHFRRSIGMRESHILDQSHWYERDTHISSESLV